MICFLSMAHGLSMVSLIHHDTSLCPNDTTTQTLNNMVATSYNKTFSHMIIKCYNKMHVAPKLVREGDRKQEVYNWWPKLCT